MQRRQFKLAYCPTGRTPRKTEYTRSDSAHTRILDIRYTLTQEIRAIHEPTMLNPPALYPAKKGPNLNNVRDSYRPAASLTRSIPQGVENANVLALGSSHLKDVLYTAYQENGLRS